MEETEADFSIKIILVGSSGVGKTSLVSAFFDNPFENQALPTVAPASCNAIIEVPGNKKVELQIWDTAGQERFQAISQMFYRDSHIAFVCFDGKQQDTIENWVSRVRGEVPECIIFLVATKGDTLSEEEISELNHSGTELVAKYKAKSFLVTSAKTGNGVKDLFEAAALCYSEVFQSNEANNEVKPIKKKQNAQGPLSCCK